MSESSVRVSMKCAAWLLIGAWALGAVSCVSRREPPLPEASPNASVARSGAEWPGQKPDGSLLLPNQWSLHPAGKQVELGDLPINIATHPTGQFAAVLHSGYSQHEIIIVDIPAA